jgi:hypothetical protein
MANTFRVHFGNNSHQDFVANAPADFRKEADAIAKELGTTIRKIKLVREATPCAG